MFKWKLLMSIMLMALMIGCTATPEKDDDDGDDNKKKSPTVVTYTVTFNSNGGSAVSSAIVSSGEKVIQPAAPTKTGFGFAGWYKEDTFATEWNFTSDTVTGNITLYAKWTANSYTITYHNFGDIALFPVIYNIETPTITLGIPTLAGYNFMGWYDNAGLTGTAVTTIPLGSTGAKELWAKWEIKKYNVIYNLNGGDGVVPVTADHGSTITKPNDPTKDNSVFIGWYKDSGLTTQWNFASDTVTTATTLYAKWAVVGSKTLAESKVMVSVDSTGHPATLQGREVTLSPFGMGKYEVTYLLWYTVKEWATSNGYNFQNAGMEGSVTGGGDWPNYNNVGKVPTASSGEPVTMVSWRDCIVWCNAYSEMESLTPCYKTAGGVVIKDSRDANATVVDAAVLTLSANGYRLPTEAEWEYAASYKDGTSWTPADYLSGAAANYQDDNASLAVGVFYDKYNGGSWTVTGVTKTVNVGTKAANSHGLFDMSGNVWEWCGDRYGSITAGTPVTDPTGAGTGSSRVIRGGSWDSSANRCQVGFRNYYSSPDGRYFTIGFRVSRSAY